MKYRGNNKFYCEIGMREDMTRYKAEPFGKYYKMFVFRLFFLIKKNSEGDKLKFGRDYIGINYQSNSY